MWGSESESNDDDIDSRTSAFYVRHGKQKLLLPRLVSDTLHAEAVEKRKQEEAAEKARIEAIVEDGDEYGVAGDSDREKRKAENELAKKIQANPFFGLTFDDFPKPDEDHVAVIDLNSLTMTGDSLQAKYVDSADKKRVSAVTKLIRDRGPYRKRTLLQETWRQDISKLARAMPNFATVVDILASDFAYAEARGDRVPHPPPICLVGAPGIGKSMFCEELAKTLGVEFRRIQMEGASTGADLGGSNENWANSKWGQIADVAFTGTTCNPLVILEECDKPPQNRDYSSPHSALLAALEKQSASQFSDRSIPWCRLNVSNFIWLANANAVDTIPEPIRSRMLIVFVPAMTHRHSVALVRQLYSDIGVELGGSVNMNPLPEAICEALASESPRSIKRVLRVAVGHALYKKRQTVSIEDLEVARGIASSTAQSSAESAS